MKDPDSRISLMNNIDLYIQYSTQNAKSTAEAVLIQDTVYFDSAFMLPFPDTLTFTGCCSWEEEYCY